MSPQNNRNQSKLYGVFFIPAVLIGVAIIAAILVMSYTGSERTNPSPGDGPSTVSDSVMNELRTKYDHLAEAKGNPDAPVTIREFGDYQCPACGAFEPIAEKIRQNYVNTGKVRFLFYDFPLAIHAHSQAAAIAARCAADQHHFWPYHNRLYATQSQWADEKDPTSTYLDIALETGLDTNQFKSCIKNETPLPTIKAERKAGQAISLRATPTVLVGDTLFVGGTSYDNLKSVIDNQLSGASGGSSNTATNGQ